MWMMGYNDSGDFNVPDSFNSRRLRPLMPRPLPSSATSPNPSCTLTRIHGNDFVAFNHHLAMAEQSKREFNTHQVVVSSRWNPTPEQLQTLEELYRRGTRTPSADQIQHITAQLRKYGKIEGKNVFYWFQNHKARERQKRRRQLESVAAGGGGSATDNDQPHVNNTNCIENTERKESGANRTGFEVERQQIKNWPSPSTLIAEKSGSTQRGTKAGMMAECRAEGWVQFEDGAEVLQQRRSLQEKNATWNQMMHLSSSSPSPPPPTHHNHHLISATTNHQAASTSASLAVATMEYTKQILKPHQDHHQHLNFFVSPPNYKDHVENDGESQTLQLFPLRCGDENEKGVDDKDTEELTAAAAMNTNLINPHYQFFEFLPLKN